ncbi:thioredoxin family protein [Microcella daejeonensis]|uniref:Thioredoxin family protein n=1 Tax=Microcella daejeonensis TaxID=2994971 RepID=A0A9E8MLD3_9MICO|nr:MULTISPECIES: thioredoxin family protein [Microcella]WAB81633.1 thioredoxin family protein [Microcella daejeonensis]
MRIELFTSAFCDPCHRAREVVAEAQRLVPELVVEELDVAAHQERALAHGVTSTPTIVVRRADDSILVTAEGVPTLPRLLTALAEAKG